MRKIDRIPSNAPTGAFIATGELQERVRERTLQLVDELPADVLSTTIGVSALVNLLAHAGKAHGLSPDEMAEAVRTAMLG